MRLPAKPTSAAKSKTVRLPSSDEAMKDEQPREGIALPEPSTVKPKAVPATTTEPKTVEAVPAKTKPVAVKTVDSNATATNVTKAEPVVPQPEPTLAEPIANVVGQDKQVAEPTPQVSRPQVQPQIIDLDNIEEYLTTRGQPTKVSLDAIIQRIPNEIQETPESVPADLSTSPVSILQKPQKQTKSVLPLNGKTSVLRRSAAMPKRSVLAARPQADAFVEAQKLNGAIPKLPLPDMPMPKLVHKFDTELQSVTAPGYEQTPKQMGPTLITRLPEVWDEKR